MTTLAPAGERMCLNRHEDGWQCNRVWQHHGEHHAYGTSNTEPVKKWRGGRSYWTQGQ